MAQTTPRTAHVLKITLRGIDPPVERVVQADAATSLGVLHEVIQAAFHGDPDVRHMFSDQDPFPHGLPPLPDDGRSGCAWHDSDPVPWRPRRRWADAATVRDWRDPNVLAEDGDSLASAFARTSRLHYECTDRSDPYASAWLCIDDIDTAALDGAGSIQLVAGRNASPLCLFQVPAQSPMLRAWADREDPDHGEAVDALERACGPWGHFDPAQFDVDAAQQRIDRIIGRRHQGRSILDATMDALPPQVAVGLQRHLAATGLDVPAALDPADATRLALPFTWLIARGDAGLALEGTSLTAEAAAEWALAGGFAVEHADTMTDLARSLRVARRFRGRFIAMKGALPLADDPLALCGQLAQTLTAHAPTRIVGLVLIAIADGSIGMRGDDGGLSRITAACRAKGNAPFDRWSRNRWQGATGYGSGFGYAPRLPDAHGDPALDPRAPAEVDEILAQLAPWGLAHTSPGSWSATPLLQQFARSALHLPASASTVWPDYGDDGWAPF